MKRYFPCGALLATLIIGLDQWSKQAVLSFLSGEQSEVAYTSFFNLVAVLNRGISFGMLSRHDQPIALAVMSIVVSLVLLVWLWRCKDWLTALSLGCIIGGALGNSIDRFLYGGVVDFLDFHAFGYHWPAFNLADSTIFIGVVLLCIQSMFMPAEETNKGPQS